MVVIHSVLLLEGRVKFYFMQTCKQNFVPFIIYRGHLLFWIEITPLPSFVSFCDPYSEGVCATLADDFCKIAILDVLECSGPVYP